MKRGDLGKRLDYYYHKPEFEIEAQRIRNGIYPLHQLGRLCNKITDGTHYTPSYIDDGEDKIKFISVKDVREFEISFEDVKYISEEEHLVLSKCCNPKPGDILLTKIGTIGLAAVIPENAPIFDLFVSVCLIQPKKDIINSQFLCLVLNSTVARLQFARDLKGVGVPDLHLENIAETLIPLPPFQIQRSLVAEIEAARQTRKQKLAQADELLLSIDTYLLEQLGLNIFNKLDAGYEDAPQCFAIRRADIDGKLDLTYNSPLTRKKLKGLESGNFKLVQLKSLISPLKGIRYGTSTPPPILERSEDTVPFIPPIIELDIEIWRTLSDADRALGELAGLGRTMPNPTLLIRPFIRREAVLSSRIEGTQTNIANLYAYETGQLSLPGVLPPPPEGDAQEVLNYVRTLEYGLDRLSSLPICLRFICELHERLVDGVRGKNAAPGEFRRYQNYIAQSGSIINDARFIPPPVPEMHQCLNELEKYLHDNCNYPPLIRIGLIHYQFESIHPFMDGNGRIGRLLISLLLLNWNLLPLPLLYLSAYFEKHRQKYYDFMLGISKHGNWREWLIFFLQGVTEQSKDAVIRSKKLQDLQIQWRNELTQARATALLLHLADSLFESPVLTIPQAQEILDVTYRSAQQNVEKTG